MRRGKQRVSEPSCVSGETGEITHSPRSEKFVTEKSGLLGSSWRSLSLTSTEYSGSWRSEPFFASEAPSFWGMEAPSDGFSVASIGICIRVTLLGNNKFCYSSGECTCRFRPRWFRNAVRERTSRRGSISRLFGSHCKENDPKLVEIEKNGGEGWWLFSR